MHCAVVLESYSKNTSIFEYKGLICKYNVDLSWIASFLYVTYLTIKKVKGIGIGLNCFNVVLNN